MKMQKIFTTEIRTQRKTYLSLRSLCPLWFIFLFSACIPASPPANVSATPGAAAIITQDTYQNDVFRGRVSERLARDYLASRCATERNFCRAG